MNTKRNKTKILLFVGLLLAVAGLTLGFAAFSNTLTIKSSATVTPDSSTFSVQFSASETEILVGEENSILPKSGKGEGAIIDGDNPTLITNIKVNFDNNSVGSFTYEFYVHNTGEYDAYLNEIIFHNVDGTELLKKCTAIETGDEIRATDSLVDSACENVFYRVSVTNSNTDDEASDLATKTKQISEHKLSKDTVEKVTIYINSNAQALIADGPYTIEFGDVELVYSTVDVNATTE